MTLEEIQNYVTTNHIRNKSSMSPKYKRALTELEKADPTITIKFNSMCVESSQEDLVVRKLIYYSIKNIKTGVVFPDLIKNSRPYRFDILLKDYNLIIEVNGKQHFGNGEAALDFWKDYKDIDVQGCDKAKKEAVEKKGYKVVYFSKYKKEYDTYEYFEKVYTDMDDLLTDNGIPMVVNPNYEKDLEEFCIISTKKKSREEIKKRIQDYINDNKISGAEEFHKKKSVLANLMYEYGLRSEITFINDKPYDPAKIKTIEDINDLLKKNNILTTTMFKTEMVALYSTFSYHHRVHRKWKAADLYYNKEKITVDAVNRMIESRGIHSEKELFERYVSVRWILKKHGIDKDLLVYPKEDKEPQ